MYQIKVFATKAKDVMRTADVKHYCKLDLGTVIEWCETNEKGEYRIHKGQGDTKQFKGMVVADYENFVVIRDPGKFNYCLNKCDIATRQIAIKGIHPKVPRVSAYECLYNDKE